ncbi:hypothetical protein ACETK8_20310 (plasmid) [Brevundimonas staleyi]|uniref:Uncharacterized protein n=1 Tax=Brevundimonas staleyi TaxID=74326 RepID=A0ABW0FQ29_9CAUL
MSEPAVALAIDEARAYAAEAVPDVRIDIHAAGSMVRVSAAWPSDGRDVTAEEVVTITPAALEPVTALIDAIDRLERRVMPADTYRETRAKTLINRELDRRDGEDDTPVILRGRLWQGFLDETGLTPNDAGEVTYRGVTVWRGQRH